MSFCEKCSGVQSMCFLLFNNEKPENESGYFLRRYLLLWLTIGNFCCKNQSSTHPPKHPIKNFTKLGGHRQKIKSQFVLRTIKSLARKKLCFVILWGKNIFRRNGWVKVIDEWLWTAKIPASMLSGALLIEDISVCEAFIKKLWVVGSEIDFRVKLKKNTNWPQAARL